MKKLVDSGQSGSQQSTAESFLSRLALDESLSAYDSRRVRQLVSGLSERELAQISERLLDEVELEPKYRPALIYFILIRRYPDLVPNLLGRSIGEGLRDVLQSPGIGGDALEQIAGQFQGTTGAEVSRVEEEGARAGLSRLKHGALLAGRVGDVEALTSLAEEIVKTSGGPPAEGGPPPSPTTQP